MANTNSLTKRLAALGPQTRSLYTKYLGIALANNLPCPTGMALYCTSRAINGGPSFAWPAKTPIEIMGKARATTAQRWLAHFLQGGSLKALRYKNRASLAAHRAAYHSKMRATHRAWANRVKS